MSAENIERVRGWHAGISGSPEDAVTAVEEFWEPDGDYYPVRKFPDAQPRHGRREIAEFIAGFLDAYSTSEFRIQDLIDVGGDRVLARTSLRTEGHGSGLTLEGDVFHCYWLRHGRAFRVEDHLTLKGALHAFGFEAETLEAAGLRPAEPA